jgi:hypothetical protein
MALPKRERHLRVAIILPRKEGGFYRACPQCTAELDMARGEWVAALPSRSIHGYRISQLISSKVDPGEILEEYRTTRFPDRFYNLKIGIPWADLDRRLDEASVLALCTNRSLALTSELPTAMGVDTGRQLHAVILQPDRESHVVKHVITMRVCESFEELA